MILAALAALVLALLPVLTFLRVLRLQRELDVLRDRLDRAERMPAPSPVAMPAPVIAPHPMAPPSPPPAPVIPAIQAAPVAEGDPEQIERQIGERLLLYAGMVVLVLGVAFFLRYAFERQWISPIVRVLLGGIVGAGLIAGGLRLARAGYRQYGLFVCGGGLAVLFLSTYAAFALYALIGRVTAFVMLALIATGAAVLADRESSLPLAFMSVTGGFVAPFLVGGGTDAQITLFSYDALLIAATMYLAHRRGWPALNVASLALTMITVVAWAATYYTSEKYLRTELFLTLYCGMFAMILRENVRSRHPDAHEATLVLWCAPVAYHLASLAILNAHGAALLIYLIAAALVIVIAAAERGSSWLRLAGWGVIALPLVLWISNHQSREWLTGLAITSIGVWLLFLVAQARLVREGDALDGADTALLHANGVGLFVLLYEGLQPFAGPWQLGIVATLCAGANAIVWAVTRPSGTPAAWHWVAVSAALLAIAVAVSLEGAWIVVMWAAEGTAVLWMGTRLGRKWFRSAGLVLIAFAVLRWAQPDMQASPLPFTVLINSRALSGMVIIAALYLAAWLLAPLGEQRSAIYERAITLVGASALTVFLISSEIWSYWTRPFGGGAEAPLARSFMLSAWWAAYAAALIAIGMRRHYAPIRYFAIALFGLTLAKVFVVDFQQLGGLYRVAGFVVVGVILLLVSFLYQRSRADTNATA